MAKLTELADKYLYGHGLFLPKITYSDILEIIILVFIIYKLMVWIRNTRAWALMRGLFLLMIFLLIAYVLQMDVILWLAGKAINIGFIFIIIMFQPELRKGLEHLGHRNVLTWLFPFESNKNESQYYSGQMIHEVINACVDMSRHNTGALIMNIFEHNTPLHDGAVIIKNERIDSATCYLPLSDNMMISKELGTRHRAAVGISEISDSITVVVSEETGGISVAIAGRLYRDLDKEQLRSYLVANQNKTQERVPKKIRRRKRS